MRPLRQLLNSVALALALTLCAVSAARWARSYWADDSLNCYFAQSRWVGVVSYRGATELFSLRVAGTWDYSEVRFGSSPPTSFDVQRNWYHYGLAPWWRWRTFGFATDKPSSAASRSYTGWSLLLPDWLITTTFGALTLRLFARRRRGFHHPGLCPACGYDLRATPGRCPECGRMNTLTDAHP